MRSRLYLQFYLALLGILVLFALGASLSWVLVPEGRPPRLLQAAAGVANLLLPRELEPSALEARVAELSNVLESDLALFGPDGRLLADAGHALPRPGSAVAPSRIHGRGRRAVAELRLSDGRRLLARHRRGGFREARGFLFSLAGLAIAVGLVAYPVARRLTRRLEDLRLRVDELGAGDLGARVPIEGKDEVALLAESFNRAADQIEGLVDAQRRMLAGASHELRSPLARLQVAIDLLADGSRPDLEAQVATDIEELDALIGEILLASRLESPHSLEAREPVDLLAALKRLADPLDIAVVGTPTMVQGDRRMLERLIRNLLDNALRHGGGQSIEARLAPAPQGGAVLEVLDRGPGVAEEDRDRIFEPFYRAAGVGESDVSGTGLGLALVRQIARAHGGDAHALAREGGGSCFRIVLH